MKKNFPARTNYGNWIDTERIEHYTFQCSAKAGTEVKGLMRSIRPHYKRIKVSSDLRKENIFLFLL